MLLGQKITERVAGMRTLPAGIDQRSACRHPDWTGPDDLAIKILELREITDWEKPIFVKIGATRTYYDIKLAVAAGADVVVLDGMQGGTAATQDVFIEHVGIPTLAAIPQAVAGAAGARPAPRRCSSSSPAASAPAPTSPRPWPSVPTRSRSAPPRSSRWATTTRGTTRSTRRSGRRPGSTTTSRTAATPPASPPRTPSSPRGSTRSSGGRRLANYLRVLTMEAQTIARACGKSHLQHLEPEDLVALTDRGRRHGPRAAGRHRRGSRGVSDEHQHRHRRRRRRRRRPRGLRHRLGPRRSAASPTSSSSSAPPSGSGGTGKSVRRRALPLRRLVPGRHGDPGARRLRERRRGPRRRTSASTRPATSSASARRTSTPCTRRWPNQRALGVRTEDIDRAEVPAPLAGGRPRALRRLRAGSSAAGTATPTRPRRPSPRPRAVPVSGSGRARPSPRSSRPATR